MKLDGATTRISFIRQTSLVSGECVLSKLNGANAVSFVVVKHVLENFDFWQVK